MLDDLYDELEGAQYYDGYLMALCPFHDDHRPSLRVTEKYYKCLACGKGGKPQNLLNRSYSTYSLSKPRRIAPGRFFYNPFTAWLRDEPKLGKVLKSAHLILKAQSSEYLIRRGINKKTTLQLGLGMRDDWYTIPIFDCKGKIAGATARRGEENISMAKYVNPPKQSPDLLYVPNWKRVKDTKKVFLVFGILDAITLEILGYPAMSTTVGKSLNPMALDWCRKQIIIIPDFSEERAAMKLTSKLGWRGSVLMVKYKTGINDINDFYLASPQELKQQLA